MDRVDFPRVVAWVVVLVAALLIVRAWAGDAQGDECNYCRHYVPLGEAHWTDLRGVENELRYYSVCYRNIPRNLYQRHQDLSK